MIIDCISDLHGFYPKLTGGDLLFVAGDLTARDSAQEHSDFVEWCKDLPYRKIIVIAGNHDNFLQRLKSKYFGMPVYHDHCEYLCDSGVEFEGLKIWGSPWTKTFEGMNPKCKAFTLDSEEELSEKWALIPDDTDILITHSPSFGNFDITTEGLSVGSISLWMMSLTVRPKLHVFGHIHEAYGEAKHYNGIHLVNASVVNENYRNVNNPVRVII